MGAVFRDIYITKYVVWVVFRDIYITKYVVWGAVFRDIYITKYVVWRRSDKITYITHFDGINGGLEVDITLCVVCGSGLGTFIY